MNSSAPKGRKNSVRLRYVLIIAALLVMLFAGVASRFRPEPAMVAVPDLGGTYVEAAIGNPRYLNPVLLQFNQLDRDVSSLIFSGLTRFDDTGQIVADLAERWEVSDGGRTYLFRLRKDVRWHDRTPFTADDVVFTIQAIQAEGFQGSQEVADVWRMVEVQSLDDFTVRFALKEPFAPFLEYTSIGMLPRHLYADALGKAMTGSRYNLKPVGTGPFKLTRISAEGISLEPAVDYYGPAPHLSQLGFKFYLDYTTALAGLEKGEVDAMPYLEPQDVARLSTSQVLQVLATPDYQKYSVLFLNNSAPVFKDKSVRRAVAYGVNRERIVQTVLAGNGVSGKGPVSPASWAYDPRSASYEYDPMKAQALLDAAGWNDTDGDGIRDKDGAALTFVILTNDNQRRIRVGELVAEDLRKVGFRVEVQVAGWSDLLKEFLVPRTFVAALAEHWLLTADPDVQSLWHSNQIGNGGFDFSGLDNKQIDQLLDDAHGSVDRTQRQQLYSQFQAVWAEESPSVVLYYPNFNWVVSKTLKDAKLGYLVDGSSRFRGAASWYTKTKLVPAEQK